MRDFQYDDEDDEDEVTMRDFQSTPTGRTYVHDLCGGQTHVSGGDFNHICDPFWPCTGTFCCTCGGVVSLSDVRWADTEEPISEYRSRARAKTPFVVQAWRYGLGLLCGGALGAVAGWVIWFVMRAAPEKMAIAALAGAAVGAVTCYLLGTMILNMIFGVNYRRMR